MTAYVLPPTPTPSLTVLGRPERFAVHRIYCVGRNYAEHAREMGHDPQREAPFFFSKPADAVFEPAHQGKLPFPGMTSDLHHEVEWVIALGAPLHCATPQLTLAAIWGQGVGIDLTRRDLQAAAKAGGKPWDVAKGFDRSAVMGALLPLAGALPTAGAITLSVNGQQRQRGDLRSEAQGARVTRSEKERAKERERSEKGARVRSFKLQSSGSERASRSSLLSESARPVTFSQALSAGQVTPHPSSVCDHSNSAGEGTPTASG